MASHCDAHKVLYCAECESVTWKHLGPNERAELGRGRTGAIKILESITNPVFWEGRSSLAQRAKHLLDNPDDLKQIGGTCFLTSTVHAMLTLDKVRFAWLVRAIFEPSYAFYDLAYVANPYENEPSTRTTVGGRGGGRLRQFHRSGAVNMAWQLDFFVARTLGYYLKMHYPQVYTDIIDPYRKRGDLGITSDAGYVTSTYIVKATNVRRYILSPTVDLPSYVRSVNKAFDDKSSYVIGTVAFPDEVREKWESSGSKMILPDAPYALDAPHAVVLRGPIAITSNGLYEFPIWTYQETKTVVATPDDLQDFLWTVTVARFDEHVGRFVGAPPVCRDRALNKNWEKSRAPYRMPGEPIGDLGSLPGTPSQFTSSGAPQAQFEARGRRPAEWVEDLDHELSRLDSEHSRAPSPTRSRVPTAGPLNHCIHGNRFSCHQCGFGSPHARVPTPGPLNHCIHGNRFSCHQCGFGSSASPRTDPRPGPREHPCIHGCRFSCFDCGF